MDNLICNNCNNEMENTFQKLRGYGHETNNYVCAKCGTRCEEIVENYKTISLKWFKED